MKRFIASLSLALVTLMSLATMVPPVMAQTTETITFTAQLLSSNEVPPISNAEAGASGSSVMTLTVTRDAAGNITSAVFRFDVSVNGLLPTSVIILSHIHEGPAGVNGPVRVDSGLTPATGIPTPLGSASFTRSNLATSPAIAAAIIANPAGWYFNVHTALNPGGVVRGQLVRAQQTTPGIGAPTLSEWGLILMTLLFVAACTFFLLGRGRAAAALGAGSLAAGPVTGIDWRLLTTVTLCVEAVIALALVVLRPSPVDVAGSISSGLLIAFVLHLFISSARRR